MGPGWAGAGRRLAGQEEGISGPQRSAMERWADSGRVGKREVPPEKLRRVFEAIGGETCFGEDVAFDVAGNDLRISFGRLGLAAVVEVIRPKALDAHMGPPSVVPAFEFGAQAQRVWMFRPMKETLAAPFSCRPGGAR
jgi:hypothetical protein